MNHYGHLKIITIISVLCFSVAIACLITIYTQMHGVRTAIDASNRELSSKPEPARLTAMEDQYRDMEERHFELQKAKEALETDIQMFRFTVEAQKEELKNAIEQIRALSAEE